MGITFVEVRGLGMLFVVDIFSGLFITAFISMYLDQISKVCT